MLNHEISDKFSILGLEASINDFSQTDKAALAAIILLNMVAGKLVTAW